MTKQKPYYFLQQADREADLYLFGDITPYRWKENDMSAHSLVQQIKNLDVDTIRVHIDSRGGSVAEGWGIYNALREHPARVETYGDGFVASAALYPFMAGEERYASQLSAYYFHQVVTSASGYASDLRAAAEEAEILGEVGLAAFPGRTKRTAEEVRQLQKDETWLTPEQALEKGIATAILADDSPQAVQDAKRRLFAQVLGKAAPQSPPQPKPQTTQPARVMKTLAEFFAKKEANP